MLKPRARAMTLIEILIGAAILAIAVFGIYELFFSGAKTAALSIWRSNSTTDLKNGLYRLRNDLGRASYPSTVTDSDTLVDDSKKCTIAEGRTELNAGPGASNLMEFWICKPEITIAGASKAGEEMHCVLEAEGNKLRYRRDGSSPMDKIIVSDVEYVELSKEESDKDPNKSIVTIEIGTVHPKYETTKVIEKTKAKVEVEVIEG